MPTAPVLADRLELKRTGHEWHGPCPACGGEDRFHVREGDQGRAIIGCRGCIDGQPHEVRRAQFKRIMALVFGEKESKPQLSQSEIDRINRNRREAAGNRLRAAREASKQARRPAARCAVCHPPLPGQQGVPGSAHARARRSAAGADSQRRPPPIDVGPDDRRRRQQAIPVRLPGQGRVDGHWTQR